MNNLTKIAVSGAGGGVGQGIIKSLQGSAYEIIALDNHHHATGLYSTASSHLIPHPDSPSFIDEVVAICEAQGCRLLFPGLDTELAKLAASTDRFAAAGITVIVSSEEVVRMADNKALTSSTLAAAGIAVPTTIDLTPELAEGLGKLAYPYILKRRQGGSRSRDVYLIDSERELGQLMARGTELSDFVAQEYIEGDEYTCGSINLDDECKGVIVMRRILRGGDTYKCFSVRDDLIESVVEAAMNAIKPFGACNAQLRMKGGVPYVFEINARCSGTTGARTLSGFNEPLMIADYLCHGIQPEYTIAEHTILRYWNELTIPNKVIEQMRQNKSVRSAYARGL